MGKLYTLAKLAEVTGIPPSTVRYYRDKWPIYFPYKGEGRKKRYEKQAVEVLLLIRKMAENNESAENVEKALRSTFTAFIDHSLVETETVAAKQQQQYLETIGESLALIADQRRKMEEYEAQLQEVEDRLLGEIEDLEKKVDKLKGPSWWDRLLNRGDKE